MPIAVSGSHFEELTVEDYLFSHEIDKILDKVILVVSEPRRNPSLGNEYGNLFFFTFSVLENAKKI